jgi:hypothetical protein
MAASEINQAMARAEKRPRKLSEWKRRCQEMITLDESVATECFYALPRRERGADGNYETKIIKGPSARFAEIIVCNWGNCRAMARVAGEDTSGQFVRGQGTFHDLESNFHCGFEVTRRITNKSGNKFNADMIQVTGNAAASIAYRNAMLKGIPGALWKPLFILAQKTAVGDIKTLTSKREEIIKTFMQMGVPQETLFAVMGIKGKEDINGDKLIEMKGLQTAIQNGDADLEAILEEWSRGAGQDPNPGMFKNKDRVNEAVNRARAATATASASTPDAAPPATEPTADAEAGGPAPGSAEATAAAVDEARKAQEKLNAERGGKPEPEGKNPNLFSKTSSKK